MKRKEKETNKRVLDFHRQMETVSYHDQICLRLCQSLMHSGKSFVCLHVCPYITAYPTISPTLGVPTLLIMYPVLQLCSFFSLPLATQHTHS